jgi:SPP1 gp7 family putative phage head morphogenesis protein
MTTTLSLNAAAAAYRAALLRRDAAALRALMAAYQPAYDAIQREVAALTTKIAAAQAAGTPLRPAWLRQQGRLEALEQQILQEWSRFAGSANDIITATQREAVLAGALDAAALVEAAADEAGLVVRAGADLARLNTEATQALVGVLQNGSPLRALLDGLGADAADTVQRGLLRGVAIGRNPRQIARDIRTALGGNLNRALTIARTEHMRAYRSATLERFQANGEILRGWQWRAAPSERTCPLCLAMDGREFGLDEPFASHVSCRCTAIPLIKNRDAPRRTLGADWFATQDAATQRGILGPGAFDLYREGKLSLGDLVQVKHDPVWGPTLRRKSLKELNDERIAQGA